jgi:serine/threonine-protein kinase RsbW
MIKRTFRRDLESLNLVFDFFNEFFYQQNLDEKCRFAIQLAVEEVVTNLIKYNKASKADISLQADKTDEQVVIQIQDSEVESFDISKPPAVNIHAALEERRVGGLGLFLVHQVMDHVDYRCENKITTITLIKKIK